MRDNREAAYPKIKRNTIHNWVKEGQRGVWRTSWV